jgi:hypothetical protein
MRLEIRRGDTVSNEPQRPYFIPKKQREQSAVLKAVTELVKQLADAAPKIDHTCKVVKKE